MNNNNKQNDAIRLCSACDIVPRGVSALQELCVCEQTKWNWWAWVESAVMMRGVCVCVCEHLR